MVDISLDITSKDLKLHANDLVLTKDADPNGTDPVLQDVLQRIQFFLGEWFLDSSEGVPWYQQILVKNPDQSKIDAIFMDVILGTPGIVQLMSYSFVPDFQTRRLTVTFRALATTGQINYSGAIAPVGG